MFAQLPTEIQKKVLHFLETDDFRAAKALFDQWHALDKPQTPYTNEKLPTKSLPVG